MVGIYKITNPKGKVYIGQSIDIKNRWNKGHKYNVGSGLKLKNSLNKYGFENHIFEIIEECNINQLSTKETYWINFYDTYKKGLNSTQKGGLQGYKDEEWRKKHSEGMKGRKGYWKGKQRPKHSTFLKTQGSGLSYTRTEEHKEQVSKSVSKSWEKDKVERCKKISQGKLNKGTKPIICIETDQIFNSIKECSEVMGISKGCICSFVKGKYSKDTLKGYTFKYYLGSNK